MNSSAIVGQPRKVLRKIIILRIIKACSLIKSSRINAVFKNIIGIYTSSEFVSAKYVSRLRKTSNNNNEMIGPIREH